MAKTGGKRSNKRARQSVLYFCSTPNDKCYQQATSVQMLTDIGRDPAPARSRSVIQQIVIKLLAIHDR